MSYYSYGSSNIGFNTFPTWANNVSGATNITLPNALSDFYPAQSAPYSASVLVSANIFYGSFVANTGGTIALTQTYLASSSSSTSITLKNFNLSAYNPTVTATATYPYTFHSWRTGSGGGGTQITTSTALTVSTSTTQATTYYAYFTTTHVTP